VIVDETYSRANEQLAEFRVLLDLAAERLWDLQSDFMVLRDEMVKCYAMLATLTAPVELQPYQEQPPADIWGDQTSACGSFTTRRKLDSFRSHLESYLPVDSALYGVGEEDDH
jgi:hypothetical protein